MKTVKFFTLGCKVNQYDTQSIRERFLSRGFQEAGNSDTADIYLINTCTVTSSADQKSRNIIRQCIRENKSAKIIVTGCMAEDPGFTSRVEGIHYVIRKRFFPEGIRDFSGRTRAFLKIQDGCNNFCSYCAVPLARGRSRSRNMEEIRTEAELLAGKG
ncbi:MAG: tRNA (N(6)-L-threonylcarbamoyladenosine(37)-C(2))-methylthiotransferase MtaB, partial [Candidatus Omnitrophica bacterium]|nr:tRNA (N(6)-L-threonylcarbamoyladenosine(37)-C(2))-methylthiotransferase MtaB [Candidatus Omnitrophota bacterium]